MATGGGGMLNCHLKSCTRILSDKDGRVEVCTVLPKGFKTRKNFCVSWKKNGEAKFHADCWARLTKATRSWGVKSKKKKKVVVEDQIELSSAEKTMIKEAMKTAERHDSYEIIQAEAKRIADMLRSSTHCVAFTGAGISTSAGIGDYRGKSGKWTEMDRDGVVIDSPEEENEDDSQPSPTKRARFNRSVSELSENEECEEEGVAYEQLRPTYTHEALHKLLQLGRLKHIMSQNGDGLHGLSGIPFEHLSELHGNVFLEKCEKCGKLYERSFYVMDDYASLYYEEMEDSGKTDIVKPKHAVQCKLCGLSHRTGRRCEKQGCGGYLKDSIINFRDNLEDPILDKAIDESKQCDLFLCLGTTLLVTSAADLVDNMLEPQRYVVCNRQKTHLDKECTRIDKTTKKPLGSRVFGDCDLLMREVMKCILSPKDLQAWENRRSDRMKVYDSKRKDA